MENLRWILLVAGIFFILAIYIFGRQRRRKNSSDIFDPAEEIPEFSARDWDELDEGVGEVRVVARAYDDDEFPDEFAAGQVQDYDVEPEAVAAQPYESADFKEADLQHSDYQSAYDSEDLFEQADEFEPRVDESHEPSQSADRQQQQDSNIDIIVLYILAKPSELLSGEKINSAARANGLVFGRMNIFHRLDENGQAVFSLANMVEPGNFDPDTMHQLTTSGLTVFMQLSNLSHPSASFDAMLGCAYHISEMLGAQLCNQHRQPITQADAEYYRKLISMKENA